MIAFPTMNLITLLVVVAQSTAVASIESGPFRCPENGHYYYRLASSSWTAAEQEAVGLGGHLATIRSKRENDWIYNSFGDRNIWIGLNDASQEGLYVWASGEPLTYTNWAGGEPNNNGDEDYVHFYPGIYGDKWNDAINTGASIGLIYGIVEISTPTLVISSEGSEIVLSWTDQQGWALQSSTTMGTNSWSPQVALPAVAGVRVARLALTPSRKFFRLVYTPVAP